MNQTESSWGNSSRTSADDRSFQQQRGNLKLKSIPIWFILFLLVLAMPIVIGSISFVLFQLAEQQAAHRLESLYTDIDSSPSRALKRLNQELSSNQNISRQHTALLEQLETLADVLASDFPNIKLIPYVSYQGRMPRLDGIESWPHEPITVGFLELAEPLFRLADQIAESPVKIWRPHQPSGLSHINRGMRFVFRDLNLFLSIQQLEIHYALYQRDVGRAWAGLQRLKGFTKAKYGDSPFAGYPVTTVLNSLQADLWDELQLQELSDNLCKGLIENSISDEQVRINKLMFLNDLGFERSKNSQLPLSTNSMQNIERIMQLYDISMNRWLKSPATLSEVSYNLLSNSEIMDRGFDRTQIDKLLDRFLSRHQMINRIQTQDFFRLTQTALAIKTFQLKFGHWPSELSDLAKIDLTSSDWSTVAGHPFGYRQQDDSVLIWLYERTRTTEKALQFSKLPVPINPPKDSEFSFLSPSYFEIR